MRAYSHAPQAQTARSGVSEIIIPCWQQNTLSLIFPMLSHLSQQCDERWLTCVGNLIFEKKQLEQYHFKAQNVRQIRSLNDEETLWMAWDALSNGTSAVVVASFNHDGSVKDKERLQLEQACMLGHAQALVLKTPQKIAV